MSYLVLARKWRPKRFAELVGQEHVVRALTNALDSGRVHHAFLFTGTRGVGKTTIARIFAKSLNCERGTGADPCGECETCLAIDAGRYIDLLEIDAASNTGVDDVREVIENAQYMPSRGKYKVYLIDEVHMLSKAAFNALLKTLEEPPEHVKFLLATTDPQKLPVTVLSRCLQFNLKRLDEEQIRGQMIRILAAEGIAAEDGAIRQLAKAADGSLRDGLSLLDQAIAYSGSAVGGTALDDASVAAMLGTVDRTQVAGLLQALVGGDGRQLLDSVAKLADFSPDWAAVLEALAEALHRIQVKQLVPDVAGETDAIDVAGFAASLRPEVVQLWYQMALHGRRDLPLAPSARAGFEMSVLRMLAFRPAQAEDLVPNPKPPLSRLPVGGEVEKRAASAPAPVAAPSVPSAPVAAAVPEPTLPKAATPTAPRPARVLADAEDWLALLAGLRLGGLTRELAANTGFVAYSDGELTLSLPTAFDYLRSDGKLVASLADALAPALGVQPKIGFDTRVSVAETLHDRNNRMRDERQQQAEATFMNHPDVQRLMQQGARLVADSIRPADD